MNKLEFSNDLIEKANSIGVEISQKQAEQFYTYMELLLEWNEKMNLTAITDPEEVILKHFINNFWLTRFLYTPMHHWRQNLGDKLSFLCLIQIIIY